MKKENKKLILVFFLAILIMINFVSAFGGEVEYNSGISGAGCQSDSECSSGQQCVFGNCVDSLSTNETPSTNNNSITSALIISLGVIAGLAILGLLIRKRNK